MFLELIGSTFLLQKYVNNKQNKGVFALDKLEIIEDKIGVAQGEIFIKIWKVSENRSSVALAPIILFHESLGSVALWRNFPEKLALITGRDVIAYDRLGFGQSSRLEHPLQYSFVEDEARSILPEILKKYAINQFVVMGHSVGGGMASICAVLYPEQCQALISESAQSKVEQVTLDGIRVAKENFKNEKLLSRLAKYHADKTQWVLDAWTETWLSDAFANWNLDEYLVQITCPVLAIHGENDEYATLEQPRRFVDLSQGENELYILKDCGHFPHIEKQAEVLEVVKEFLSDIG